MRQMAIEVIGTVVVIGLFTATMYGGLVLIEKLIKAVRRRNKFRNYYKLIDKNGARRLVRTRR